MKKIEDVCIIIQARLSSQRCPRKMIRPFAGSSLTEIAINKVLNSKIIPKDNFYLSVYEPELREVGERLGVNIFHRSEYSAVWDGGVKDLYLKDMYEWHDKLPFKYVVFVNACAPLLKTTTIDNFFSAYLESDNDGMFAVLPKKNYFWNTKGEMLNKWPPTERVMNTKAVEPTLEAAHCLYASRMDTIKDGVWMGDFQTPGEIELVEMPEEDAFDVDYEWEFELYEALYKQLEHKLK
jgi:CMP-N-acetylneuraminic acid synthetase